MPGSILTPTSSKSATAVAVSTQRTYGEVTCVQPAPLLRQAPRPARWQQACPRVRGADQLFGRDQLCSASLGLHLDRCQSALHVGRQTRARQTYSLASARTTLLSLRCGLSLFRLDRLFLPSTDERKRTPMQRKKPSASQPASPTHPPVRLLHAHEHGDRASPRPARVGPPRALHHHSRMLVALLSHHLPLTSQVSPHGGQGEQGKGICARARHECVPANARHAGDGVAIAADPPVCLHPAPFLSRSFRRARSRWGTRVCWPGPLPCVFNKLIL